MVLSLARRSLSAAEQLSRAGYGTIAWVNGGLDTAKKTDLPVSGSDDLRYGGIGGLSELLGWTDVQREKSAGALGGPTGPIKLVRATCPPNPCMCRHVPAQLQKPRYSTGYFPAPLQWRATQFDHVQVPLVALALQCHKYFAKIRWLKRDQKWGRCVTNCWCAGNWRSRPGWNLGRI